MPVPTYPEESLMNRGIGDSGIARQGFARGSPSCRIHSSSPSTVTVYDLPRNERMASVNLTLDVRNAIRGLEVWPY
jgi:hypothetical protein